MSGYDDVDDGFSDDENPAYDFAGVLHLSPFTFACAGCDGGSGGVALPLADIALHRRGSVMHVVYGFVLYAVSL